MPTPACGALPMEEVACPLCGARGGRRALTAPDWFHDLPGEFVVEACASCGHLFLNPRPSAEALERMYPAAYAPHHASPPAEPVDPSGPSTTAEQPWYLSRAMRAVPGLRALYYWLRRDHAWIIPEVGPGRRALELGCADGRFLAELGTRGWSVQGVEPIAAPALRAQRAGFDVHIGTLESATFPPASFDAAFAWMVLEHVPDPRATLHELRRVLRPEGWLVFSVPNAGGWERRLFGRYWYDACLPQHFQHFTPGVIRKLLASAGFRLERIVHQANQLDLVGSVGLASQRLFPRSAWPRRLIQYPDDPRMPIELALAPMAKLLAALRLGGRLTVVARAAEDGP